MARIAGIDLPREKRIEIGLTYIYGIGRTSANEILAKAGIDPDIRVKDLTEDQEAALREVIDHPPRPAGARTADQDQCPDPEGSEEDHCQ